MPTSKELARTGRRAVEEARGRLNRAADSARHEWRAREGRPSFERAGRALSSGALVLAGWKPGSMAVEERRGNGSRRRPTERAFPGVVDPEAMSREELYERAKELAIPGRSKMSKEQLARAVAERGG